MDEAPKSLHQVLEEMDHVVDGEFRWPNDPARRCEVARLMWGHHLVTEILGVAVNQARDIVLNPLGERVLLNPSQESRWRESFASMSPDQREIVLEMMCNMLSTFLFSTLVAMDQPPRMEDMQIRAMSWGQDEKDGEPKVAQIAPPVSGSDTSGDLHDEMYFWIDLFSVHADVLR